MSAQQDLTQRYGRPDQLYVRTHCIQWSIQTEFSWFPAASFLVNSDFRSLLTTAFTALQAAGLHTEIHTFDGCYNPRRVRGGEAVSLHAWAAAIDLNAASNPMAVNPTAAQRTGSWSPEFISTMKASGLYFGGNFHVRADPMHWAMGDG